MKIFDKIKNVFKSDNESIIKKDYTAKDYAQWVTLFGEQFQIEKQYYRGFTYGCINARAENIAKADILLYKRNTSRDKRLKEITNHLFIELIQGYNLYGQTFRDLLFLTMVNLDIWGNCLWIYTKDVFGAVNGFYILPTDKIKPKLNDQRNRLLGYELVSGSQRLFYNPEEVIHFQMPNYQNLFWGTPTIDALKNQIAIDYLQSVYQESFYKNDASIGTVLSFPQTLNDETFKRLNQTIQNKYSDVKNAKKFMVLEGDGKIYPFTNSPKEADYIKSREAVRDEIYGVFRVPKTIMGLTEGINYASSMTAMNNFLINTIYPLSDLITSRLNSFIKREFDERLYCVFEYETMGDPAQKNSDMKMLSERGAISINELREQYNYDYLDDPRADQIFPDKNESNEPAEEVEETPSDDDNSENNNNENE